MLATNHSPKINLWLNTPMVLRVIPFNVMSAQPFQACTGFPQTFIIQRESLYRQRKHRAAMNCTKTGDSTKVTVGEHQRLIEEEN